MLPRRDRRSAHEGNTNDRDKEEREASVALRWEKMVRWVENGEPLLSWIANHFMPIRESQVPVGSRPSIEVVIKYYYCNKTPLFERPRRQSFSCVLYNSKRPRRT